MAIHSVYISIDIYVYTCIEARLSTGSYFPVRQRVVVLVWSSRTVRLLTDSPTRITPSSLARFSHFKCPLSFPLSFISFSPTLPSTYLPNLPPHPAPSTLSLFPSFLLSYDILLSFSLSLSLLPLPPPLSLSVFLFPFLFIYEPVSDYCQPVYLPFVLTIFHTAVLRAVGRSLNSTRDSRHAHEGKNRCYPIRG